MRLPDSQPHIIRDYAMKSVKYISSLTTSQNFKKSFFLVDNYHGMTFQKIYSAAYIC